MNKSFLITRPNHDYATNYLFCWSASIINLARRKNFRVVDLSKNEASPSLRAGGGFIFMSDPLMVTKPLRDTTAALFLKPSNLVASTLLKGHSASEADVRAKKAFKRNIRKLLTSETQKEDSSVLRFLFWDMKHQVCLGDAGASL